MLNYLNVTIALKLKEFGGISFCLEESSWLSIIRFEMCLSTFVYRLHSENLLKLLKFSCNLLSIQHAFSSDREVIRFLTRQGEIKRGNSAVFRNECERNYINDWV